MPKYWSNHEGRYVYYQVPESVDTKYKIELKLGYYELSRNIYEPVSSPNEDKKKPYEMKAVYDGKLFDIISESLYDSIGQYMMDKHIGPKNSYYNFIPLALPVYLTLHINSPKPLDLYHYIKLNDTIDADIFEQTMAGQENKQKIILKWALILKNSELMKPFLNKGTKFLTWDPGKGNGIRQRFDICGKVEELSYTRDNKNIIQLYDPKLDSDLDWTYKAYRGLLEIDPSDEYCYNIIVDQYNKIILDKLIDITTKCIWELSKDFDYSPEILSNKEYIEHMPENDAFVWSSRLYEHNMTYDEYSKTVKNTYVNISRDIPKPPQIGDRVLKTDKDNCIYRWEYIKENYPDFYNRVGEIINEVKERCIREHHEQAVEKYEKGANRQSPLKSDKLTHIDIIKAFLRFRDVYDGEIFEVNDPEELDSYFKDIFGCVAEYLSKAGSEQINKIMNDKLMDDIKSHPRIKQHLIAISDYDYPYKLSVINEAMNINIFKWESDEFNFFHNILNCVGFVFPILGSKLTYKLLLNLKRSSKNIELGKMNLKGRFTQTFGLTVNEPFDEIKLDYQLIPVEASAYYLQYNDGTTGLDHIINSIYGIKESEEMITFKHKVFDMLKECLTGEFDFEVKDKQWDKERPPYNIYMEIDMDRVHEIIEEIKKDRTYQKILWLKQRNIEWKLKREAEREQWKKDHPYKK